MEEFLTYVNATVLLNRRLRAEIRQSIGPAQVQPNQYFLLNTGKRVKDIEEFLPVYPIMIWRVRKSYQGSRVEAAIEEDGRIGTPVQYTVIPVLPLKISTESLSDLHKK